MAGSLRGPPGGSPTAGSELSVRAAARAPGRSRLVAASAPPQLEFRNVSKNFLRRGGEQAVLAGIDLRLPAGAFYAVTGASGSGKTTLLELAVGLQRPTTGAVELAGVAINHLSETRMSSLRLAKIGLLFKDHLLIDTLSAVDNVALPLLLAGAASRSALERAHELLGHLGLGPLAAELPAELSQGEQNRLRIARALINEPQLLVADEPTAGLDSVAADEVMRLLAQQVEEGLTVLMATHDVRAAAYAQRAYRLTGGRLERS